MFTGLVETVGRVRDIRKGDGVYVLSVISPEISSQVVLGQSIAVSGACLTVSSFTKNSFEVDVTDETMKKTKFSKLKIGQDVNLERALSFSSRLDGHIVNGHVDGVAEMVDKKKLGSSWWATFRVPGDIEKYIVTKGSVALDGVSLTVAEKDENYISIALIPTTISGTTLKEMTIGDQVNLEVDVIGRYVESLLMAGKTKKDSSQGSVITMASLNEIGW